MCQMQGEKCIVHNLARQKCHSNDSSITFFYALNSFYVCFYIKIILGHNTYYKKQNKERLEMFLLNFLGILS